MRTYEFDKSLKLHIRLGETTSGMCFIKRNEHFTPAVLCMKLEVSENEVVYNAVPGIIYWDNDKKMAVREKVDFGPQKELGFPIREKLLFEEEAEETEEQSVEEQKKYYVLMEKICCALEVDCITPSMRRAYADILKLKDECEMKRIFRYFFPEAAKKLF